MKIQSLAYVCCLTGCMLFLCSCRRQWSNYIVYDQQWSSASGPRNLTCSTDLQLNCAREARDGEANFLKELSDSFKTVSECRGIQFIVDPGLNDTSPETKALLIAAQKRGFWRLRVDYHPRLPFQSFRLDTVGNHWNRPGGGEGDATHIASFTCEMSHKNGVIDVW